MMSKKEPLNTAEMLRRVNNLQKTVSELHEKESTGPEAIAMTLRWAAGNSFRELAELFTTPTEPVAKVIQFAERHEDVFYDGSTRERVWMACYNVVKCHHKMGWFEAEDDISNEPEEPKTPLEEAEGAEGPVAHAIHGMWSKYETEKKRIRERRRSYELLCKALESKGRNGSAKIYLEHSGWDYYIHDLPPVEIEENREGLVGEKA